MSTLNIQLEPRQAKTCLRAHADCEGPDQPDIRTVRIGPLLTANRIIGHSRMYQWQAMASKCPDKTLGMLLITLPMLEDTFPLGPAVVIEDRKDISELYTFNLLTIKHYN